MGSNYSAWGSLTLCALSSRASNRWVHRLDLYTGWWFMQSCFYYCSWTGHAGLTLWSAGSVIPTLHFMSTISPEKSSLVALCLWASSSPMLWPSMDNPHQSQGKSFRKNLTSCAHVPFFGLVLRPTVKSTTLTNKGQKMVCWLFHVFVSAKSSTHTLWCTRPWIGT